MGEKIFLSLEEQIKILSLENLVLGMMKKGKMQYIHCKIIHIIH